MVFPYPKAGIFPGIENSVENLALNLKMLGHSIKIITTFWNGGRRIGNYKGIPILRVLDSKKLLGKLGSLFILSYYTFGLNLINKKNLKFFIDSDAIILPLAIGFTKFFKYKNIPVFNIFHHADIPKSLSDLLTIPFYDFLVKRQFKIHHNIIVRSNYTKSYLLKHYKINEDNIRIIPDGVDLNNFNPNKMNVQLKINHGKYTLLCVGPFYERKKIPILLKAMPNVIKNYPSIQLVLVGKGPRLNYCKDLSKKLGIESSISFKGYISKEDLCKYYATSNLFIFPSELEGFGQVLLEAMASGTPIICANNPPMSEIIENCGITFQLNDSNDLSKKIIGLLRNPKKLENLKNNCLLTAKKYRWIEISDKYIDFINEKIKDNNKVKL